MKQSSKIALGVAAGAAALVLLKKKKDGSVAGIGTTRRDLIAKYDSRRMFYGKATVEETPTFVKLYSYDTMVARYNKKDGKFEVLPNSYWAPYGRYTQTTNRHISEFANQLGIDLPHPITVGVYY